jgi:hypothetical protein
MQPVHPDVFLSTQTGEAIAARLIFLPLDVEEAYQYVYDKHGRRKIDFGIQHAGIELPLLKIPSPRQMDWLFSWYDQARMVDFQPNEREAATKMILSGMAPAILHDAIVGELEHTNEVNLDAVFSAIQEVPERLEQLPIGELTMVASATAKYTGWTPEMVKTVIYRVFTEMEVSQIVAFWKELLLSCKTITFDDGRSPVFEPLTEEEWNEVIKQCTRKVRDFYQGKKRQLKSKKAAVEQAKSA